MPESDKENNLLHNKRLGREMAMQYLFRCDLAGELPDMENWELNFEELADLHHLRDNRYARKAREYAEKLFTLVAINSEEIERTIKAKAINWSWERLSMVDRNIMKVATAEMLFCDDVPPVVSIDEGVAIAGDYSGEDSANFINGILNAIKDDLKRPPRSAVKSK